MKAVVQGLLRDCEKELVIEVERVTTLLLECKVTKVQPPKDYWHKQVKLQSKVKALMALLETI
jgi:hypothetical protein